MVRVALALVVAVLACCGGALGASGDFEFKCETTCQLVQTNGGSAATEPTQSLLQMAEGQNTLQAGQAQAGGAQSAGATAPTVAVDDKKECYSLCLNPTHNPGCSAASAHASFLETGAGSEERLLASLRPQDGDCLNSCVRVCLAVKAAML